MESNKERPPQMLDPRSPQLGSSTDHPEKKHSNDPNPRRTPLEFGSVPTGIIGTCICLEVIVSHEDSAISHPWDQDYLSLRVGKGSEVELQQALSIYGG